MLGARFVLTGLASVALTCIECGVLFGTYLLLKWVFGGVGVGAPGPHVAIGAVQGGIFGLLFGALFLLPSAFVSSRRWAVCGTLACPGALFLLELPDFVTGADMGLSVPAECFVLATVLAGPLAGGLIGDRVRRHAEYRATSTRNGNRETGNPYQSP